jgi:signal-induced proliferation-associated 1 like protein 3
VVVGVVNDDEPLPLESPLELVVVGVVNDDPPLPLSPLELVVGVLDDDPPLPLRPLEVVGAVSEDPALPDDASPLDVLVVGVDWEVEPVPVPLPVLPLVPLPPVLLPLVPLPPVPLPPVLLPLAAATGIEGSASASACGLAVAKRAEPVMVNPLPSTS